MDMSFKFHTAKSSVSIWSFAISITHFFCFDVDDVDDGVIDIGDIAAKL